MNIMILFFLHTPCLIYTVAIILGQTEKWHFSLLLEWLSHGMLNSSSFTQGHTVTLCLDISNCQCFPYDLSYGLNTNKHILKDLKRQAILQLRLNGKMQKHLHQHFLDSFIIPGFKKLTNKLIKKWSIIFLQW